MAYTRVSSLLSPPPTTPSPSALPGGPLLLWRVFPLPPTQLPGELWQHSGAGQHHGNGGSPILFHVTLVNQGDWELLPEVLVKARGQPEEFFTESFIQQLRH